MHTITDCPRCKKDFMYNNSADMHLHREVAWDLSVPQPCSFEVICQECHEAEEIENIVNFIEDNAESDGWEKAECMADEKFGKEKTEKATQWLSSNEVYFRQPFIRKEKQENKSKT